MKLRQFNFVPFNEVEFEKIYCTNDNHHFEIVDSYQTRSRDSKNSLTKEFVGREVYPNGFAIKGREPVRFGPQGNNINNSKQILTWRVL